MITDMEQKKIDIAALLKDAPRGTKLYSPICGECEYSHQDRTLISVVEDNCELNFTHYGEYMISSVRETEPLLFPSREVHDWGLFRAKLADGANARQTLIEYGGIDDGEIVKNSTRCYYIDSVTKIIESLDGLFDTEKAYVLATGTELKLKEEPKQETKFEVGDVIKSNTGLIGMIDRKAITGDYIATDGQNEYAIIKATATLATPEEIVKWNKEVLEPNHLHYSKSKRKIIHWFLPFDRIVERCKDDDEVGEWVVGLFSHYSKENFCYPYRTLCGFANECLPYNDKTAKLVGTTDDYEEE